MRKLLSVSVIAVMAVILACGCKQQGGTKAAEPGKVLAIVNGEKITQADLDAELAGKPDFYKQRAQTEDGKKQLINKLIDQKLLMEDAKKKGINESPEIKAKVQAYEQRLVLDALRDKVVSAPSEPTEQDMKKFYDDHKFMFNRPESVRLSQIVLTDKAKADQVYKELKAMPSKFGELATKYSEDQFSKSRGGDMGYAVKGALPPEIESKVFGLKDGQISQVIQYDDRFYLFQVLEHKPPESTSFDQAKEEIKKRLQFEKQDEGWKQYLEGLKKSAKIEVK